MAADEGVHEIQLNGKQLVFMFMAVTVVAVVIFLCGVMVGRGVRAPRAAETADTAVESSADPTTALQTSIATDTSATAASATIVTGGAAGAVPNKETLTYPERLATPSSPPETVRPEPVAQATSVPERVQPQPEPASKSRAKTIATVPKADAKPAVPDAPATGGNAFVVQVAAVRARNEADTIAKRLVSKGFPSYVTPPGPGTPKVFRVRVGKYTDRREAESVARRLEKEEQFKPWITR